MKHPIIYITRDIERARGCLTTPSVSIISNDSDFAKSLKNTYSKQIFLIPSNKILDTYELLEHAETTRIVSSLENPQIVVFKNTAKIEKHCKEQGYTLLNPKASLAASIEEKLTQLDTLENLTEWMPRYEKKTIEKLHWFGEAFIIQFNHSHTGSGTIYLDSEEKLHELKELFPKRECRIAPFIDGPIFTSNIVVGKDKTLLGNINYQITGIEPFTDLPFATIGNDWGAPYRILSDSARTKYEQLSYEVAGKLKNLGWKGLFGIDAIWSVKESRWYLIEINARQPASASYESELQKNIQRDDDTITTLEAHMKALTEESLEKLELIRISDGAQIIQRVTIKTAWQKQHADAIQKLEKNKFKVITYENSEHNSDLIRIQSETSIIETDGIFTEVGEKIKSILN